MRRYSGRSYALEWVTNGRAFAPPCTRCSIGVSTSRYPACTNVERSAWIEAARTRSISRAAGFTMRSRCRCRTSTSGSASPRCLSGSGCRHLAVSVQASAATVTSPRRVVITSPDTPTWSPRSTVDFHSATDPSPSRSAQIITCRSPDQSRRVANHSRPWSRSSTTRPATATVPPVRVSGASPPWADRTDPQVWVRANPGGYGSTPRARSASSFARRTRVCSGTAARAGSAGSSAGGTGGAGGSGSTSGGACSPRRSRVRRLGTTTKPSAMAEATPTFAMSRRSSKHR